MKNKGRGLFAKKNISKATILGDYVGKVIHPRDAVVDEENFYIMYYHDYAVVVPDLQKPGVHLLNHSCVPNSGLYIYKGHTLAFALQNISQGEEITINYMLSPKTPYCNPCKHICNCKSELCIKTMHLQQDTYEKWRKVYDVQSKETKRERVQYGKELALLALYPKKIPANYFAKINKLFIA